MTTQAYEPHWEMHRRTRKQHWILDSANGVLFAVCATFWIRDFATGDYERGQNRCRSCDRSA